MPCPFASRARATEEEAYLKALGAAHVVGRLEAPEKALDRVRFDYAVDTVGGAPRATGAYVRGAGRGDDVDRR